MMSDALTGPADDVDTDVREFHRRTSQDYAALSGGGYANIAERRAVAEKVRAPWVEGGPAMPVTEDLLVGPAKLPIRIYRPVETVGLPVIIYLHGGGWTLFSINTHDRLMREYAARSGCAVVGLDYSLSPEVRFPHALGEIGQLIGWLHENGEAHGLDATRLALAGDSAGGNLAIATALKLRDQGKSCISALLLNYAAFDNRIRVSHRRYGSDTYMLTSEEMFEFWHNYLGENIDGTDPLARPILADLAGLPPVFLCIAECDILAEENFEMASRLRAADVPVRAEVYKGAMHSFLEAVSISRLASRALDDAAQWLRQQLAP